MSKYFNEKVKVRIMCCYAVLLTVKNIMRIEQRYSGDKDVKKTSLFYEQFIKRFVDWCHTQPEICATIIVGSQTRTILPADEWADLDLMIYADNPKRYMQKTDWLQKLGKVLVSIISLTAGNDPEHLVLFEGGYNVDFVFFSKDTLKWMIDAGVVPDVFLRGSKVIFDRDGLASKFVPKTSGSPTFKPPTQDEFNWIINTFWYWAYYIAKQLRRRELWLTKMRDIDMKKCLLQMMEWHIHATKGWNYDTWHSGRFLEKWANPCAFKELHSTFAHFNESDSWQALQATMNLFQRLAIETAEHLKYSYPHIVSKHVTKLIENLYYVSE